MRRVTWAVCLLLLLALVLPGCGRLRGPGFTGKAGTSNTVDTPAATQEDRPKQPVLEWGSPDAKVRVLAFFFISKDPPYPALMQLLQEEVKKYPGKLYVKYADMRTQEGVNLRSRTGSPSGGVGFLINGQSEFTIDSKPLPHKAQFDQDMNRYWTKDDLTTVIAQEVAKAYGKK